MPPNSTPEASSLRASGPAQNRVAFSTRRSLPKTVGHFHARHARRSLRLGGGGNRAPHWFSGSLERARKRKRENRCPCAARTLSLSSMPTRRPNNPGGIPSVPSSKLGKRTSHSAPEDWPRCRLCSGLGIRWIPRPSQQSTLRRRDPHPPSPSPQRTSAAIPPTGPDGRGPLCQTRRPVPFPSNPNQNAPACCPQAYQMHRPRLRRSRRN